MSQTIKTDNKKQAGSKQNTMGIQMTKSDHNKIVRSVVFKLHPDKMSDVVFTGEGALKESLVFLVGGRTSMATQFTVHRPIGITPLDDDDWVMTPTSEINYLVAREKNPQAKRINDLRALNRLQYLVSVGLLTVHDGKAFYVGNHEKTRKEFLQDSEAKAKEKKTKDRYAFLPDEVKAVEGRISAALKTQAGISACEVGVDDTYQTMGGVLENVPQLAIAAFKGKKPFELGALVPKLLMTNIGLGKGAEVTVVVNPAPTAEEEEESLPAAPNEDLLYELEETQQVKMATERYAGSILTVLKEAIALLSPGDQASFNKTVTEIQSNYQESISAMVSDNAVSGQPE